MRGKRKPKWKEPTLEEMKAKPNHWDWSGVEDNGPVFGFIYRIDEIPTGKFYIGMKYATPTSKPWQYYRGSSKPLDAAMQEYGYDSYKFTVLLTCPNRSTIRMAEMDMQLELDVIHREDCYNLHIGGQQWAAKSRHSAETKTKLKRATKKQWENLRVRSAMIRGLSDATSGQGNSRWLGWSVGTCIKTKKEVWFDNQSDMRDAGFNHSHIVSCINGKRKTHKGHTWRRENAKPTKR